MTDNKHLPAFPFLEYNENGYGNAVVIHFVDGSQQILPYQPGFSKYEEVLRGFMVALINCMGAHDITAPEEILHDAVGFTEAYFNHLETLQK